MIILVLKDGLGNQLFQYAAARCLAEKLHTRVKLDIKTYRNNSLRKYSLHNFAIQEDFASPPEKLFFRLENICSRILNKAGIKVRSYRYFERDLGFNPDFFKVKNNSCIEGYWQSEKNFKPAETIIRKEFTLRNEPDALNLFYLNKIQKVSSVSLHIRRGDYVNDRQTEAIHGICGKLYYNQAIDLIKQRISNPHFFIFSDDMEWVKENLLIPDCDVDYIDHNGQLDYEDLRLMFTCKHNIIANSSFSWWGAWLNKNSDKIVIAPGKWFSDDSRNDRDIIPAEWIKI